MGQGNGAEWYAGAMAMVNAPVGVNGDGHNECQQTVEEMRECPPYDVRSPSAFPDFFLPHVQNFHGTMPGYVVLLPSS